jgi:hypothetical protein
MTDDADDDVVEERASHGKYVNCTHISYVDPISRSIRKNDFLDNSVAYLSSFLVILQTCLQQRLKDIKILERRQEEKELVEDLND